MGHALHLVLSRVHGPAKSILDIGGLAAAVAIAQEMVGRVFTPALHVLGPIVELVVHVWLLGKVGKSSIIELSN
jgi:hypothetical protein